MKIYIPQGRAREYSPLALNYFCGCDHGCKYCYVPNMYKRFNKNYTHGNVSCKLDLKGIERSCLKFGKDGAQVLMSFTGDPYCNFESWQTRLVLEIFLKHGIHTAILTKNPGKASKDIDIFKKFKHFKIGSTLTFLNEDHSKKYEPGAPSTIERLKALKEFSEFGIETWASFEPVIFAGQSLKLIEMSWFLDHLKIGKLNGYSDIEKSIDWKTFLENAVKICRSRGQRFYIKKDLAIYGAEYLTKEETDMDFLNV